MHLHGDLDVLHGFSPFPLMVILMLRKNQRLRSARSDGRGGWGHVLRLLKPSLLPKGTLQQHLHTVFVVSPKYASSVGEDSAWDLWP